MTSMLRILCWIFIISIGSNLRFYGLETRPFHADEATGARITAYRMENHGGQFNPKHFHGPLLSMMTSSLCKLCGENDWKQMKKRTLRILPATFGTLLLFLPLLGRKRFGDMPMLLASAFLATSPLLVYYARMFIHESLLVFFGMAFVFSFLNRKIWFGSVVSGLILGLMFSTKESSAISCIAWSLAGVLIFIEKHGKSISSIPFAEMFHFVKSSKKRYMLLFVLSATSIALLIFTNGLTYPQGAIDALRTFFVYKTVPGHEKQWGYYIQLLFIPQNIGGVLWYGIPLCVLAFIAYIRTFSGEPNKNFAWIRFLFYSALFHFGIYSFIPYKTPWLACLPWAHVCLLAGFSVASFFQYRTISKWIVLSLVFFCLTSQFQQASRAMQTDSRNPFAYVPTSNDIENVSKWLANLHDAFPVVASTPLAVIGENYWPLPWYLRTFGQVAYRKTPSGNIKDYPIVFAMPEQEKESFSILEHTHIMLPRSLRNGVPLFLFVKNEIWDAWIKNIH